MRKSNTIKANSTYIILFFTLLFIFTVCSGKFRKYTYINYKELKRPNKTIKLRSRVINKFDIYFPTELKLIGDYLLFVDMKADKMIKIINLKTNEIVKSFGSKGQGPSEFIGISQIIPDIKDDNTFWVYDFTTKYLKKFNMNKILNNYFYPEEIIRIQSEKSGSPYQLMFTPDDKIIGIGLFFKGRISIYDRSGIYIKSIGKIPVVLKNEKFTPQHSHGFQGKFIFRDKSKEIFIAVRLGTIIERYSMDGNLISTLYGPEVFFPEYKIVPAGQILYNDLQ